MLRGLTRLSHGPDWASYGLSWGLRGLTKSTDHPSGRLGLRFPVKGSFEGGIRPCKNYIGLYWKYFGLSWSLFGCLVSRLSCGPLGILMAHCGGL